MNDRAAFVRRICENPADDTVRLVYADWLQDNGQPERAAWVRSTWDVRHEAACLYSALVRLGLDSTALGLSPFPNATCVVRRGFVESVELSARDFMAAGFPKRLFACQPVTRVVVLGVGPRWNGAKTWVWNTVPGNPYGFGDRDGTAYIPTAIAAHLRAYRNQTRTLVGHARIRRFSYGSSDDAREDLYGACVRYGRFLNGFPALEAAEV